MRVPKVVICHRGGRVAEDLFAEIKSLLRNECSGRFAAPGRMLSPLSFSCYFVEVAPPSEQTHDLIVRIELHADEKRLDAAESNATSIAELLSQLVNKDREPDDELSIGVSLVLAYIEWATN